jgi:membrane-bound lytic murein transglycosylase D
MLLVLFFGLLTAVVAHAEWNVFPQPTALQPDVAFWKRIYGEVGTDGGLLHDTHDLRVVYEVVKLPKGISWRARERQTDKLKKKYKDILLTLAGGKRSGLSREEQRVLSLFGPDVLSSTLRSSASRIRFQLGQADKFRAGVIRSGAYKPQIVAVLREMNLPLEIANLPHVESSYTPTVYSRVGAAGMWQFTRSTGRRYMQVDHIVDERLDPFRASVAAARLLEQNHRVTGSWPLAITAYNHGAAGMRRASRQLGTTDITTIVREYKSRTFGFASRNFYVEFLAANAVATNPEYYFGPLVLDTPIAFETVELPFYTKPDHLASALGVDLDTIKEANPALRNTVWDGSKYIPKGFAIRVPRSKLPRPLHQAVASLPSSHRYARQTRDASYTVRRGDTLSTIARRHGVPMSQLVALNGLASQHRIRVGQKLKLPGDVAPTTSVAAYTPEPAPAPKLAVRPVVEAAPSPNHPAELPEDGIYRVLRGDNLTEIANRFGLSVSELVSLNGIQSVHRIAVDQKLIVARVAQTDEPAPTTESHPEGDATLSPARSAETAPEAGDVALVEPPAAPAAELADDADEIDDDATDESAVEPSPGLLADPSDYTVASDGTILVQPNETLGHYAEWLGLRASRLRQINGLHYGEALPVQKRIRLDFSSIRPDAFEQIRVEYHRALQEDFFAQWEIEGTVEHRVGPGDSLWTLSRRRFDIPIWLLRQYNPDVNLDALSRGTMLTIPKLRQRTTDTSNASELAQTDAAA